MKTGFKILFLLIVSYIALTFSDGIFAAGLLDEFGGTIGSQSTQVGGGGSNDPVDSILELGIKILGMFRNVIAGVALIYLVLIGAYMVAFSSNEEKIKSQKKQFTYVLIGFLFLNVPGLLYKIFFSQPSGTTIGSGITWSDFSSTIFWDLSAMDSTLANIISFLQVFIFGIAVLLFTWGFFRLILSGGDEEQVKSAKNRILYGSLGLLFLGFVKIWGAMIAGMSFGNKADSIVSIWKKLAGIAIYFAGPVAILFLVIGAYYYITSGGDEERIKKGKNIVVNTFIATMLLLASYSFLVDLAKF